MPATTHLKSLRTTLLLPSSWVFVSFVAVSSLSTGCAKSNFGGGKTTTRDTVSAAEGDVSKGGTGKQVATADVKGNPKAVEAGPDGLEGDTLGDDDLSGDGMAGDGMAGGGIPVPTPTAMATPSPTPATAQMATPTPAPGVVDLSCAAEAANTPSFSKQTTSQVSLSASCDKQTTITTRTSGKLPTDILFVLDVSGSMSENLNTIKQNIISFADSLTARNWDVRYGAIGFVDEPISSMRIELSSAASFKSSLENWGVQRLCPGVDAKGRDQNQIQVNCTTQEAGLKALRSAADLLEADATAVPARAGFDKFVLYISDAYAWDTAFEDFNVSGVADLFRAKKAGRLPGLKFAHSVSEMDAQFSTILSNPTYFRTPVLSANGTMIYQDKYIDDVNIHPVRNQMTALSAAMPAVPSSVLSYPFTQDVFLSQFSDALTSTSHSATLQCGLTSARVLNAQGNTVTSLTAPRSIDLAGISAGTTGLRLIVERCCKLPEGTTCQETSSTSVPFHVTP